MTLTPLIEAGPVVQVHVAAALAALGLGVAQFTLPKGTVRHRLIGRAWVVLMGIAAAASFFIRGLQTGQFSWIHLISAAALVALLVAVLHARAGRIEAHRWTMIGLFAGALVITGLFTLYPGRVMHAVLFGG